jgi:hypothetical protein
MKICTHPWLGEALRAKTAASHEFLNSLIFQSSIDNRQ